MTDPHVQESGPKYTVEEQNLALVRAIGRPRRVLDVGAGIGLNGEAEKKAASNGKAEKPHVDEGEVETDLALD